jgi:D-glycero-beta-D-manno-heptose-7-phosphate kinase
MGMDSIFERFKNMKVGVVGDVMLDTYWWGHVDRISPEAPVPIVALDQRELRIGGAGNVALNLIALGASVSIFSAIGEDDDGRKLDQLFNQHGIDTSYLICSHTRKTTNKVRIISRNQQMMRLDSETTVDIEPGVEEAILERLQDYLVKENPDVIILEDYNKGILTESLIQSIVAACKAADVITAVDPKKKNFFSYKGVDIFKPNLKEVKEGLNMQPANITVSSLDLLHDALHAKLGHRISFITLSEYGVYFHDEQRSALIPSHRRNIADVSGAGDTVIAVASLVYAATRDVAQMAAMANIAGGLVCEEVGTAAIDPVKFKRECTLLLPDTQAG